MGLTVGLTPEQQAAVRATGQVFVDAGPGSGKTRVLVERFVAAVKGDLLGVPVEPERILAVTFTEKAAAEMEARLRRRLAEEGLADEARRIQGAYISTIHGFCARVLRAHPFAAGVDPRFSVLDESRAAALADETAQEALEAFVAEASPEEAARRLDLVGAFTPDSLLAEVRQVHDTMRAAGIEEPGAADGPGALHVVEAAGGPLAEAAAEQVALLGELLSRFAEAYREAKRRGGWLDFEDLQLLLRRLLRTHPAVRERYRSHFRLIMVDEYQDTNRLQAEILAELDTGELFTVGDGRQSIYGFRHADVGLFYERRQAVLAGGGAVVLMTRNHRSHARLLEAVDRACRSGGFFPPGREGGSLVPDAGRATLDPPGGPRVELVLFACGGGSGARAGGAGGGAGAGAGGAAGGAAAARELEAAWVARRIRSLIDERDEVYDAGAGERRVARPGDFAILMRAFTRVPLYEAALAGAGIDFYTVSGRGYFARREVSEVTALLRVLVQPDDDEALTIALLSPFCGLGLDSLWLLRQRAGREPLWRGVAARGEVSLPEEEAGALDRFVADVARLRERLGRVPLADLLAEALECTGYDLAALLRAPAGLRRWANLRKLLDLAVAYEDMEGADLLGFVRFLKAQSDLGAREGGAPVAEEGVNAVRLMTIHAAKGLEFPIVFLADTGSRKRPAWPKALWLPGGDGSVAGRFAAIVYDLDSLGGETWKPPWYEELIAELKQADAEEEARCLYVAMTRAEQRLFITGHIQWDKRSDSWANADIDRLAQAFGVCRPRCDGAGPRALAVRDGLSEELVRVRLVRAEDAEAMGLSGPVAAGWKAASAALATGESGRGHALAEALRFVVEAAPCAEPPTPPSTPPRVSFTAMAAFAACPYRYHLERAVHLPEWPVAREAGEWQPSGEQLLGGGPRGGEARGGQLGHRQSRTVGRHRPGMDPRRFGLAVHALLESADLAGPTPGREAVAAALRQQDQEVEEAAVDRGVRLIRAFWAGRTASRLREAEARGVPVVREAAFSCDIGGTLLFGSCDVLMGGESPWIVDYKTSRLDADTPAGLFGRHYRAQAEAYALAVLAAGHEQVMTEFVFLEEPEAPVLTPFGSADVERLRNSVNEAVTRMAAGPWEPLEAFSPATCSDCPGLGGLCPVDPPPSWRT